MSIFNHFDPKKIPRHKIELHVHLDGAVRLTTIWELAQKKGISLGARTLEELYAKCTISKPSTLADFLKGFEIVTPVIRGDLKAIERVAYELCEDLANQHLMYAEVRYSPHSLSASSAANENMFHSRASVKASAREVVESVNKGLARGEKDFDIKVRSILCCIRGQPDWSQDVLDFCKEFKTAGVVGIDIAGDEARVMASPQDIKVFQEAARLGIHRTAHAAEAGPASNINIALNDMKAERIGHGYHAVEDDNIFQKCLDQKIHFEACPYSSFLTGSVSLSTKKHPIVLYAEDNANFSVSRDDPFIIQKSLDQEYSLLSQLGLRDVHFIRANFNAARSAFLPKNEKDELIKKLMKVHGMHEPDVTVPDED